jgi:hypothetical protein
MWGPSVCVFSPQDSHGECSTHTYTANDVEYVYLETTPTTSIQKSGCGHRWYRRPSAVTQPPVGVSPLQIHPCVFPTGFPRGVKTMFVSKKRLGIHVSSRLVYHRATKKRLWTPLVQETLCSDTAICGCLRGSLT